MAEFRVLGSVELRVDGRTVELGPPKRRAVFAALLADAGRPVPIDVVLDRVWDTEAPAEARAALYAHVTRIRRTLLGAVRDGESVSQLKHRGGAYLLDVNPDQVDLHRFRRLVEQARDRSPAQQAALLREALGLWRGVPFAGLGGPWFDRQREGCQRQRVVASVAWARAELGLGNPEAVIGPLGELTGELPLVESLAAMLMRALAAVGDGAEALNCYAAIRQRLADELGTDPGIELQKLHRAILRGEGTERFVDPGTEFRSGAPQAVPMSEIPAQLPVDVRGFVGRTGEIGQLDAILSTTGAQPTAAVISALSGTAGAGKTALAVHWAHRITERFPDGQLYLNLRGFDPVRPAMSPAEAVRAFLDALAVPPQRVPASLDGQTALYRSLLAGRRVLVVLDNARDADQVRPLLPGSPGSLALITSRDQLTSLAVTEGIHPFTVGLLTPAEARQLLARRLGTTRVAAEPCAVDQIIEACARLPLALAIVAARAAAHPTFPLAVLAAELRASRGRLDAFATGQRGSDLRAVFSWSYHTLSAPAARLFRLLGLHPGTDIATSAVANLAGTSAEPLLAELTGAQLIIEHAPGRYAFHDLLRAYAAEMAHVVDSEADRTAALRRVLDWYLHTADLAAEHLPPHYRVGLGVTSTPRDVPSFESDADATAWLEAERANLVAAAHYAAESDLHSHAWQIPYQLWRFLYRRGRVQEWLAMNEIALATVQRIDDVAGQVAVHTSIASAHLQLCQYPPAIMHGTTALRLNERHGDRRLGAHNLNILGIAYTDTGRYAEAVECYQRSHDVFVELGMPTGIGGILHNLTRPLMALGRHPEAIERNRQALALFREAGDHNGEALALGGLARSYGAIGKHAEALAHAREALAVARRLGDHASEGHYLNILAVAHRRLGELATALEYHSEAVESSRRVDALTGGLTVLNDAGVTLRLAGRIEESLDHHRQAIAIARRSGYRHEEARALEGLGRALADRDENEARRCREAADRLYAELGVPPAGDEPGA